ncbi:MAG TPA: discoidin domain-containing protein [Candidatus Acidoferrales bacterium]|nr:discoidin domain-containing protein [Candidatus Acidoferrales bacterium]
MSARRGRLAAALTAPLAAALAAWLAAPAACASPAVIDDFESTAPWRTQPADGVTMQLRSDPGFVGRSLRLDFDFHGGGGYAVIHRDVSIDLPANYQFTFRICGDCPPENLEFKLIDSSGDNVWWCNQRDFEYFRTWTKVALKKRRIGFAWGPAGGGEIRHVAAIEFAVTAGSGGHGSVWLDDLELEALPLPDTSVRVRTARASSNAGAAALAVDGDPASAWLSAPGDRAPALTMDLGGAREFGALVIDWDHGHAARDYSVDLSTDGHDWTTAHEVTNGNGGRDWIWLPESEARWVRVQATRPMAADGRVGIANLDVRPLAFSSLDAFFGGIALEAPRGDYPRAMLGENVFWTTVGQDSDTANGLLDEAGRLETGKSAFAIEPFLRDGGRLLTWHDVALSQSLADGDLPIPTVEWSAGGLQLDVTAFGIGGPGHTAILARYRVRNAGAAPRRDTLFLALRPFQVDPPTQFLNAPGGVATIRELAQDGRVVRANGDRGIESLTAPDGFGAAAFDQGDVVEYLRAGRLPAAQRMPDPFAHASGALAYALELPPGATREVDLLVPLHDPPAEPPVAADARSVRAYVETAQASAIARWHALLDRVTVSVPDSDAVHALRAQLGWVLVNRNGPMFRPATRSYARTWIRDGDLISSALLRLDHADDVRAFDEAFVPHQYANGKAPCCVDSRGSDPVPEHDSDGEMIDAITEYVRYTGDLAFARGMWPHVAAAIGYLDSLRAQRLTPEWSTAANAPFHGILPPSISHEGYSAKPMHSYWDDFFALRGYKDASDLAALLDRPERAAIQRSRDAFAHDLGASIAAAMASKHVDYVPGCADLGDFDATSTTIALDPANAEDVPPPGALAATFEQYWRNFVARRDGTEPWDAFTPYEWRNVGAMVRLEAMQPGGPWRDRANAVRAWLMGYRRPPGFQEWAEVVCHDERAPRFLGDMPHAWVGTDYVRSLLDMLAFEREADSSIVIGAGVPAGWLHGDGVVVKGLITRWGPISFTLRSRGEPGHEAVEATIEGAKLRVPPGGIVVVPPGVGAAKQVVRTLPAVLHWR